MLNVDFHAHTHFSKDCLICIEDLPRVCQLRGIDRLVITDHNTIAGALQAHAMDPQRFIIGEEIKTQKGELLAAFVQEEIPRGLPPLEVLRRLRQQGAFISVSHPFDAARSGAWALVDLLEIAPLVDAIEVFNSRCNGSLPNRKAQDFAADHHLPGTAGSDAHTLAEIGHASLVLPDFHDADSLRKSVSRARVQGSLSGFWVHFASTYARLAKKGQ